MKITEHDGVNLKYLIVEPDDDKTEEDRPLIFLLHGFGADMRDLTGLCERISARKYIYVCPNAPLPFQIGPDLTGYGWTPPFGEANEKDFEWAAKLLEEFFCEVLTRYPKLSRKWLLLGFSQGGSMVYKCGLLRPDLFSGLVMLSSSIRNPEQIKPQLPISRTQSIFIAHGLFDRLAPVGLSRNANTFLKHEGYNTEYYEYEIGHEISGQIICDLVPWINGVLHPMT